MTFDFVETIGAFDNQRKVYFYELLASFLSDSMRGILFQEGIPDDERVERAKWLNEVSHRITFNIFTLEKGRADYSEEEIWNMILQNAAKHPKTLEDVSYAIELSYKYIIDHESDEAQVNAA